MSPPPQPASLPGFSVDPVERVNAALTAVEGYTELALALLTTATARPVPVPLAQIVSAAIRAVNLNLDTPVAPHVSPSHSAALYASLPRVWAAGLLLLGGVMAACGDHVVPHLTAVLEHTVYLLERVPAQMAGARLQLLRFHGLLLQIYPAATLPAEYTQRLLKFSIGVLGGQLDSRPAITSATGTGRKGKKRARGAEDALVGGLEGRAPPPATPVEAEILSAALELTPALHACAPPALLNFSLRLHLALYAALSARPSFTDPTSAAAVRAALDAVLQHATALAGAGTARDIRTLLLSILPPSVERNAAFDTLLHPALPPLARSLPELAQLHMFAPESEAEKKVRLELGFRNPEDEEDEDEDEEMDVDCTVQNGAVLQGQVAVAAAVPVAQPVAVVEAFVPATVSAPAPFSAPIPTPAPAPAPSTAPAPVAPAFSAPEPAVETTAAVPFMSASVSAAPAPLPAPVAAPAAVAEDEDSDEEIPDLDSGSSDEDE